MDRTSVNCEALACVLFKYCTRFVCYIVHSLHRSGGQVWSGNLPIISRYYIAELMIAQ